MKRLLPILCCLLPLSAGAAKLDQLSLPEGYSISLAAKVKNARQLTQAEDGTLFVGSRHEGNVYRLEDRNQDGYYEHLNIIHQNLNMPTGIHYHQGKLYIAAVDQILVQHTPLQKQVSPLSILTNKLPQATHHGWKYLKAGPDNALYFNIGAPCNVCLSEDKRFATLAKLPLTGGKVELIAHGVRNSVGFDWHPSDQALWFTDNGRDWMGADIPPDELNRLSFTNEHFGFPYKHGKQNLDPEFGSNLTTSVTDPKLEMQAHTAPLGMTFSQHPDWAKPGETSLFIAQHGSWNRARKVGYQILKVSLSANNEVLSAKPFITGWLKNESRWGRPVDLLFDQNGDLLISDDYAGLVYRVKATTKK